MEVKYLDTLKKIKFRGFGFMVYGDTNHRQQDRILAHDYLVGCDTNQGQQILAYDKKDRI